MSLGDRIERFLDEVSTDGADVVDEVRKAIADDPIDTLTELGLTAGGEIYRKGGYVRAFYIAKEPAQ